MYSEYNEPQMSETLRLLSYADITPKPVDWLWYPYIPKGKVTILQGDPGEGKTTLALQLAALVSRGVMWGNTPEQVSTRRPANVIYQTAEDGLDDTIKPRLLLAKADCSRIHAICEQGTSLSLNDRRLSEAVEKLRPELIILDPLQAYLGANVDMHRANEIRPLMFHLTVLAENAGCAVLLIGHMNKQSGNKSLYRGLGSIDLTAAARSVLMMARDPQEPDLRVLIHAKSSLAPEGKPRAFRLGQDALMVSEGEYHGDLKALFEADSATSSTRVEDAVAFLQEALANGERPSKELLQEAEQRGLNRFLLNRARKKLNARSYKRGKCWYCALPDTPAAN